MLYGQRGIDFPKWKMHFLTLLTRYRTQTDDFSDIEEGNYSSSRRLVPDISTGKRSWCIEHSRQWKGLQIFVLNPVVIQQLIGRRAIEFQYLLLERLLESSTDLFHRPLQKQEGQNSPGRLSLVKFVDLLYCG